METTTLSVSEQPSSTTLDTVLKEMQHWRTNKAHPKQAIPDELWKKIFHLADIHSASAVRKIFGLNSKQYKIKHEQLCQPTKQVKPSAVESDGIKTPIKNAEESESVFCEVNVETTTGIEVPPLTKPAHTTKETLKKIRSNDKNLSSYLDLTTVIIECIHADGHRLKIHASHESLTEVMQAFYKTGTTT